MLPRMCACGDELVTPYERRVDKCYECELWDRRMYCAICDSFVGLAFSDGRPTFCSDACESKWYGEAEEAAVSEQ